MVYDCIIIGLGPAGIAASIYAKRSGLNVLVLESRMPGGLVNFTNIVNNYPGFIDISGPELAEKLLEHFNSLDIEYKNENVVDVKVEDDMKKVITKKNEYCAKNVIIATGRSRKSLNVEGEENFRGYGISYCAMCDGHFYKDKDVVVVGGGDSALEEALYLAKIVKSVKIVTQSSVLTGSEAFIESIKNQENIEVLLKRTVAKLRGEEGILSEVELDDGSVISASGIFVYIGFDPVIPFATDLKLDNEKGYLLVDEDYETNVSGIYAVGDIIKKKLYQIISAEYDGACAASAIARKLTKKN